MSCQARRRRPLQRGRREETAREDRPAHRRLHLPGGRPRPRRRPDAHRRRGRGGRVPARERDGPPVPDPGARAARARDARGLHHARLPRRAHREGRAAGVGHRGQLPRPRHARQDHHHARRALQGPRVARHRRGVEQRGGRGPRPVLPGHGGALRAARGDPADLPADVERLRRPLRGQALPARAHAERAAVAAAAAPADPHRRRRGEEDAADGRPVRRRLQPVPQPGPRAQAGRAARALRRRRPRLRRRSRRP